MNPRAIGPAPKKAGSGVSSILGICFGLASIFFLGGCAVSASVGLVRYYPSEEVPVVKCYIRAHEYLPPFLYFPDAALPKRAVLVVSLNDDRTSEPVLRYQGKLRAAPRNLDFTGHLKGDLFVVRVNDRQTRQAWTIEFQRQADGQFKVSREEGVFRR